MPELILHLWSYHVSVVLMHYNVVISIITNCVWEWRSFAALVVVPSPVCCGRCVVDRQGSSGGLSGVAHSLHSCVFHTWDFAPFFSTDITCNVTHVSTQSEVIGLFFEEGKNQVWEKNFPVTLKKKKATMSSKLKLVKIFLRFELIEVLK